MSARASSASQRHGPDAPAWCFGRFVRATVARLLVALYRMRVLGARQHPATGRLHPRGQPRQLPRPCAPVVLWLLARRTSSPRASCSTAAVPGLGAARGSGRFRSTARAPTARPSSEPPTCSRYGEPVGMFPEGTRQRPGARRGRRRARRGPRRRGLHRDARGRSGRPRRYLRYRPGTAAGREAARASRVSRSASANRCSAEDFPEGGRKEKTAAMTAEIMRRIAAARDAADEE